MPASPDPELTVRVAKETVELYARAADELLAAVARRLASGITSPGWAERKLIQVTDLRNEAQALLDEVLADLPATVDAAMSDAYAAGGADAAADGIVAPPRTTLPPRVRALAEEAVTSLRSTHLRILRSVEDVYRAAVYETGTTSVVAGTRTRRQAAQQVLDRFANQGITGFVDRRGRAWQLESYTEMAVRTSAGRAQVAGTLDRFTDAGRDLVIVSDAPQECQVCRPWEGRVLSISGATSGFPTVSEATGAGLFHANCRHALGAYIAGVTRRFRNTADPEGDQLRQEQRRLERGVRQWKRREAVALDDDARRQAVAKKREWQGRLKSHVDDNDLKRLRYREQTARAI